jgi:hypothetical protein
VSSVTASEVLRVRRLLGHHVREITALIPASPEDTAALTREVLRAIAAGVELEVADADAMGRRIAGPMSGESGLHPPTGTGTCR